MTVHSPELTLGVGPRLLEIFLEPTCPFSVKAFRKINAFLDLVGEDKVTVKIHLISQPWHMYSGVIVRAILAASTLEGGRDKALAVISALGDHREEFEFEDHARGPNLDTTPRQLLLKLRDYSGVDFMDGFDQPDLDAAVKRHTKYGRQNGIHVSPTFMLDGLVQPDMGSGDPVESWAAKLA